MNQQNQATVTATPQTTEQKVFSTIDGNSLMAQEYEPLQFTIDSILPHGIFILAGSTGLICAVDGVFVLTKDKRTGSNAKLTSRFVISSHSIGSTPSGDDSPR